MARWTKEQLEAIEKSGTNIIVSAGAGSGKTAVLSERVIYKLKQGIHINELLILTFTKAAASEMKVRIRKKIKSLDGYKDELNLINSAYITTFDSFALSLVKKYHYLLNLDRDINITDESVIKLIEKTLIDQVFEEFYSNNDIEFSNMIKKYCLKNDSLIRKQVLLISKKVRDYIDKDDYLKYLKTTFFENQKLDSILKDYYSLLEEKRSYLRLELDNLSLYFDSDYLDKVNQSLNNILTIDVKNLYQIRSVSIPSVPKGSPEEGKEIKKRLKSSADELIKYSDYGSDKEILQEIIKSREVINVIIKLVETFNQRLNEYKVQHNLYTFTDIALLAIQIIKNHDDVRKELRDSFKEIMVDEYQDTNDIQEEFVSLIANNNVYMVGDIKQSIYRFRGSNPNIFKDKYDNYSLNNNGYKIDLIKNFRSRSEVLESINLIFELIMDNDIGGAEYKVSHEMIYGNTLYDKNKIPTNYFASILEYNQLEDDSFSNSEVEIFAIGKDIKEKISSKMQVFDKETNSMRSIKYSDIAIILDRSYYFNDYKKIFEYLGIPLSILKDESLNMSVDFSLIRNMVDLLLKVNDGIFDTEFKHDFMSVGRSFLYEYSDEYLFDIVTNKKYQETTLYQDFKTIESLNSKTSSEVIKELIDVTNFYQNLSKVGDYEAYNIRIKTIYNLASSLNDLGYDLYEFKDYLSDIIENGIDIKYNANIASDDAVNLITIHGSKGLEYPICYFADLDHKFNTNDIKDLFIVDKKYGIIIPSELEETNTSVLKELYKRDYFKEEIGERIRLFYVALTRAREKAIILLPNKETDELEKDANGVISSLRRMNIKRLSDILYFVKPYLKRFYQNLKIEDIGLTKDYLYQKISQLKVEEVKDILEVKEINIPVQSLEKKHFSKSSLELNTKEKTSMMAYGTRVHEILEFLDLKNPDLSDINDEMITKKIKTFLAQDILKNIKDANIYQEFEFIYEEDGEEYHGIIDLMLVYNDHIDIIDYKLKNILDDAYKDQLNGYKKYLQSFNNKEINIYLYSILDEKVLRIE